MCIYNPNYQAERLPNGRIKRGRKSRRMRALERRREFAFWDRVLRGVVIDE